MVRPPLPRSHQRSLHPQTLGAARRQLSLQDRSALPLGTTPAACRCPNSTITIILPFKGHRSADTVRRGPSNPGKKTDSYPRPALADDTTVAEIKPPPTNQQRADREFRCCLCDSDHVGHTHRHPIYRSDDHKHPAIGKYKLDQHDQTDMKDPRTLPLILKKRRRKPDRLSARRSPSGTRNQT